jgi:hypothetical protein
MILAVRGGFEGGRRVVDRGRIVGKRGHALPVQRAYLKLSLRLLPTSGFRTRLLCSAGMVVTPDKEDVTWVHDGSR